MRVHKAHVKFKPTYPKLKIPISTIKVYLKCNSALKEIYVYTNGIALCV